jgi:hypothetical protein
LIIIWIVKERIVTVTMGIRARRFGGHLWRSFIMMMY